MKTLYTARAEAKGGRDGSFHIEESGLAAPLVMPKSLGGTGAAGGANPEQLFAAGYAACFASAIKFVAGKSKQAIEAPVVRAEVSIGTEADGGFGLATTLRVRIPNQSTEQTQKLIEQAHQVCPYSRVTRGNMEVTLIAE